MASFPELGPRSHPPVVLRQQRGLAGVRWPHDPNERHDIVLDIACLTDGLDYPSTTVTVLSPACTFWEKATLIHVACHRGQLGNKPRQLSRHWFDLMCLAAHDIGRTAISSRTSPGTRRRIFHAGNANYDQCLDGRLRLVPDDDQLSAAIRLRRHAQGPLRRRQRTGIGRADGRHRRY